MKITIEFEDWRELRAILVGLASTIELPEPCEGARTPTKQEEMMQAFVAVKNKDETYSTDYPESPFKAVP